MENNQQMQTDSVGKDAPKKRKALRWLLAGAAAFCLLARPVCSQSTGHCPETRWMSEQTPPGDRTGH